MKIVRELTSYRSLRLTTVEHHGRKTLDLNNKQNQRLASAQKTLDAITNCQSSIGATVSIIHAQLTSIHYMNQRVLDVTEHHSLSLQRINASLNGTSRPSAIVTTISMH